MLNFDVNDKDIAHKRPDFLSVKKNIFRLLKGIYLSAPEKLKILPE